MPRFFAKNSILGFKETVRWYVFLVKYRLPLSLRRNPGWSMDVRDLEAVIDVLRTYLTDDGVRVVELGSGISTLVLAHILPRLFDQANVISVEGEESYVRRLRDQLKSYQLDEVVFLHHVPYVRSDEDCWFSRDELRRVLSDARVDILIVDAPPGVSCPRARQPAIPFFLPYLKQNGIVFLHDTCRQDESAIAEEWGRCFITQRRINTRKGIAFFAGLNQKTSFRTELAA